MPSTNRIAVIGAGIIGAAVARELLRRYPDARVVLFEKESHVAGHQTGHNSGVVHAGLYYTPGSLKARLCRRGVDLITSFAEEHDVAIDECGKVVVAQNEVERERLDEIYRKATANGVPDVALIGPERLRELEPNVVGEAALHSPHTAIIDYIGLTKALVADFERAGGEVRLSTSVERVRSGNGLVTIITDRDVETFDNAIVCGGLQSDRLARASGAGSDPSIVPFFGQDFVLDHEHADVVNGLIYPVPDPAYPFLGVHVTRRIDGELMIGPNAFLSFAREQYKGFPFNLRDALAIAKDAGFWRFASQNAGAAARELGGVFSMDRFVEGAAKFVPQLSGAKGHRAPRGVRAQAVDRQGKLVDDFVIQRSGGAMFLRNAPSPGATSSMAIAEYLADELAKHADLGPVRAV
jgi:L-2-hydroxyglutarate oxidase LhgO